MVFIGVFQPEVRGFLYIYVSNAWFSLRSAVASGSTRRWSTRFLLAPARKGAGVTAERGILEPKLEGLAGKWLCGGEELGF